MINFSVLILFIGFISFYLFQACGVKGKPQPPAKPPFIGQGLSGTPVVNKESIKDANTGQTK
jgi:hypothetical protein